MRIFSAFLLVSFFAGSVVAHPPKSVEVKLAADRLEVNAPHPVKNPSEHYIDRIRVSLNGKVIIEQTFSAQQPDGQYAFYNVPFLKKGDKISVNARCNKFGDLNGEVAVP